MWNEKFNLCRNIRFHSQISPEKKLHRSAKSQFKTDPKLAHRQHKTTSVPNKHLDYTFHHKIIAYCVNLLHKTNSSKKDQKFIHWFGSDPTPKWTYTWLMVSTVLKYRFKKFRIHTVCFLHLGDILSGSTAAGGARVAKLERTSLQLWICSVNGLQL